MSKNYYIHHRGPRTILEPKRFGIGGVTILAEQTLLPSERTLPPHFHPGLMEICYFVSGERLYHVNGEMFLVGAGHVFVAWPDEIHWVESIPYGKALYYYLRVALPERPKRFLGLDGKTALALVAALRGMPRRHFPLDEGMHQTLAEIFRGAEVEALDLSLTLANWLLALSRRSATAPGASLSGDIADAVRLIKAVRNVDELTGALASVESIAREVGLSTSRFKAKFKQELGLPPWEYILRHRVAMSAELLLRPGATVTRVAMDLGFYSSQHFTSTFRRFTGMTPTGYMRAAYKTREDGSYGQAVPWMDEGICHGYVLTREPKN